MQRHIENALGRIGHVFGVIGNVCEFGLEHDNVRDIGGKTVRVMAAIGKGANSVSSRAYAYQDRIAQIRLQAGTASFA